MPSYNKLSFQFFVDATQVVYVFHMIDVSIVSRLVMNHSGTVQRLVWVDDSKIWYPLWSNPDDHCDTFSPCGPNRSPQCGCPQGFQPKNPTNWGLRDGSDGCVRKTGVDCRNGTDGFALVSGAKLPDTSSSTVDWAGMTLDQCKDKCLKNCSCTAYAQANISGSGSGCILWSTNLTDMRVFGSGGQDLYVRAAAADLVSACWFLRSSAAKRTEASMTRHAASIFWDTASFLLLYLLITLLSPSNGADNLTLYHPLADGGQPLISRGGSFALGFFGPDGSDSRYIGIWYHKISVFTVVWVANRQRPVTGSHGSLSVAANGTLVITGENSTVVWSSPPLALSDPVAQLLDDGNFVVREADGNSSDPNCFAWQSFDYPTDTLLPGMKLGWNLTTGFNRQLTSWTNASDPAPGEYNYGLDLRGDPQFFEWSGARAVWRAGPWNGLRFTGVPLMPSYNKLSFQFFVDATQVVYVFHMIDVSIVSRLVMNHSGTVQRLVWVDDSKIWNPLWSNPDDHCDTISPCGPNAVCYPNRSPQCGCPQGFQPKNPTNWGLRDGSDGCVRKTEVDCRNGTDGFALVSGAKLPDTSSSTVEWVGTTLDQCRVRCLKNCSCTAYAQANISGSGSGCILWSTNLTDMRVFNGGGQDLYVRAAAADVGLSGMATSFTEPHNDEGTEAKDLDLPLFDLGTVADATGNFSVENKLGEGGFGPVYKGKLEDEQEIAVKRLSKTSVQGVDEFKNEVVLIAKLQHRNLVLLLGCCIQGEERMLIYEYMPNGSLDSFLFGDHFISSPSHGILRLHSSLIMRIFAQMKPRDSRLRIIHRDLKASNILLDMHMNPKISDFGMARIFGGDDAEGNTKRVVGTGYMSPEYAMDGIFSVKSDVFSFGVLVLEIISGKKNRGIYDSSRSLNLLGYTWSLWREGKGLELVDEAIGDSYPKAEVLRCMKVGLLCVQERPEDRPTMSVVMLMLGSDSALLPQPRQPGFVAMRGPLEPDSSASKQDSLSNNNVTVTMFEDARQPNKWTAFDLLLRFDHKAELIMWRASFLLLYLLITLLSPSNGADTLTRNHPLADGGQPLISRGGSFALGFFGPDGSDSRYIGIWYHKISVFTVVWVANRQRPVTGSHGSLSVAANGTLVITGENSTVVWSSLSLALSDPVAQLLDDGNFVVREKDGNPSDPNSFAWQSFDYPTDTLLPGMKLGWNLTARINRQLTPWTNASDPAQGEYTFGIDLRGDPQAFEWSGTSVKWRGGPWNGLRFTGIPQMASNDLVSLQFFVDTTQVVYVFQEINDSIVSRLVMNHSGTVQRLVWVDDSKIWNPLWSYPDDHCDTFPPCGPNAVCDPSKSPQCVCPRGFRPKNPANWGFRDGSDGCVRKTEVDCRKGTDRFALVSGAKLPDTSNSTVDWAGMTLDQCKAKCLKNCSCTAYARANISGSGSGCILWSTNLTDMRVYGSGGQDLYVRAAAADLGMYSSVSLSLDRWLPEARSRQQLGAEACDHVDVADSESSHHWIYLTVITVILALFMLILALVGCRVWRRKKRSSTSMSGMAISLTERHNDEGTEAKGLDLPLFDLGTVAAATGNFSIESKLGEGGFGPVYKGKLEDEQEIAVKRLSETSVQGVDEFKNEVVLIAKLQHRNLVRLLGCCVQGEERMLIYEYMPNGSLDSFLFEDKAKGWLLNWPTRYSIIVGIARGLLYLHQDSRLRIIHRDLKASNILLDMHMNPKISDFGMARIFGGDDAEGNTKRVVGTGYMSPEYAMDGIFSVKSDVYSFGVLVLEIISGKKNRGNYDSSRRLNLLGYTWRLWREGKGLDLVDEAIGDSYPQAEVLRCMKVGLLCVQERPEDRPTMSAVMLMLGSVVSLLPEPRRPGFVATKRPLETDYPSPQDSVSVNNVSVTIPYSLKVAISTVGLLLLGKWLEPLWGSKEFLKFIIVVNLLTSICVFVTAIALYYITRQESYLYTPFSGFHGVLSGFLVGIKQILPDQELSLFILKIKAKWMPTLVALISVTTSFFTMDSVSYLPTLLFGIYMSWIYLRYFQRQPETSLKGDPSDDFSFSSFFPEFLRPVLDPIASVFHWVFCGRISDSSADTRGDTLDGSPMPGSDSVDAIRRRERGARALEQRLAAGKLSAEGKLEGTSHEGAAENV
ncbi:serine threonine-protein kinase [Musa troglodytarum]|uniref:non-specific serine/threonine protein kinase n=1 Tax=Musa troglodytarum TaxID=320322 RepID=A0A9E7GJU8_9LILI|nr:serine threonine-protein kinase [Musa troglodytarum]